MQNRHRRIFRFVAALLVLASAVSGLEVAPETTRVEAQALVRKKEYAAALARYESVAAWMRQDAERLTEWARAYAYADRHAEAVALFEEIASKFPESMPVIAKEFREQRTLAVLARARASVRQKQYGPAIEAYDSIAGWLGRDPGLLIERARAYTFAGRHVEALALFKQIVADHPDRATELDRELREQGQFVKLHEARALVEEKDYTNAVALYEEVQPLLNRDPGLLIEMARVYTYANRYADAEKQFDHIRGEHPEYAAEFLRELGDMYAWQDKVEEATSAYRAAIKQNPGDLEATIGLARTLAWAGRFMDAMQLYDEVLQKYPDSMKALTGKADLLTYQDRLSEAWELLEKVTAREPGNVDALNLKARILVWQGRHRNGAAIYRANLQKEPDDLDALEGLAFALYWDGREDMAVESLERVLDIRPSRREASKLMYEIKHANSPSLFVPAEWFDDSDGRRITRGGLGGSIAPCYGTRLSALVQSALIEQNPATNVSSVQADAIGVTLDQRLGDQLKLRIPLTATRYDANRWDVLTTDTRLLWQPVDVLFFEGGYERGVIEKVATVLDELTIDTWKASLKWKPDRFWMFSGSFGRGDYSDGNNQDTFLGIAEFRLTQEPYSKIYYNYSASGWQEAAPDYFSPSSLQAHTLGLYASTKLIPRVFVEGQCSVGTEHQDRGAAGTVDAPNIFLAGGIVYRPAERWRATARCEYFDSFADSARNYDGYRSVSVKVGLTCLFGGGAETTRRSSEVAPMPSPSGR